MKRKKIKKYRPKQKYWVRRYGRIVYVGLVFLALLGIVFFVVRVIFYSNHFVVKKIVVSGARQFVNAADLEQIAGAMLQGKNIFSLNKHDIANKLREFTLGAESIDAKMIYPSTIEILVSERSPIATITGKEDEGPFFIDSEGYVLGYADSTDYSLPRVEYEKDVQVGLFIERGIVPFYLKVREMLEKEQIKIDTINFYPKYVTATLDDDILVLFDKEKDKQNMVRAVSSLIRQSKLDGSNITRIDLRFDKVIVSFD